MSEHVDIIRRYIADASDWGDAAVGNAEAMQAYEREGHAALDALVAENQRLLIALADIATTAESDWAESLATGTVASVLGGKARAALDGT